MKQYLHTVSDILQQNATAGGSEAHIDIADWLIIWKQHPEYRDNVKRLIEELELVVIE